MMKVILAIIAVIIAFLIIFTIINILQHSGRLECKLGYSFAAVGGIFVDVSTASLNFIGEYSAYATAITLGAILLYSAIKAKKQAGKQMSSSEMQNVLKEAGVQQSIRVEDSEKIIEKLSENSLEKALSTARGERKLDFVKRTVHNFYDTTFRHPKIRRIVGAELAILGASLALPHLLNQLANSIQVPFLNALCPAVFKAISPRDEGDKKRISNYAKKEVRNDLQNNDDDFIIASVAYHVYLTFGETLGTSVRVAQTRVHYILITPYPAKRYKTVTYEDLLCALKLMQFRNKEFFNDMYKNSYQLRFDDSPNRRDFCTNYKIKSNEVTSEMGIPKIYLMLLDLTHDEGREKKHVLFDGEGIYQITIAYDGVSIHVTSMRLSDRIDTT